MVVLTLCWGSSSAIKLAAPAIPYVCRARCARRPPRLLRSAGRDCVGFLVEPRRHARRGLLAGCAFAGIRADLRRPRVHERVADDRLLYLAPCLTALGSRCSSRERLARSSGRDLLAFAGSRTPSSTASRRRHPARRRCGVAAALLWTATTLLIRARAWPAQRDQTILYQLAVSAACCRCLTGARRARRGRLDPVAVASLAYQRSSWRSRATSRGSGC